MLDDSIRRVRKAAIDRVDTTLRVGAGMQHIYPMYARFMPEANAGIVDIADLIRAHLDPAKSPLLRA